MDTSIIDIREDDIRHRSPELLSTLLKDHTMSRIKGKDWNIFWATSDYEHLDDGEVHYAKVICDEIFGRSNFIATVAIRSSTPCGVKTAHRTN